MTIILLCAYNHHIVVMKNILVRPVRTTLMIVAAAALFLLVSTSTAHAQALTRQLDIGASGSDVTALQIFFAQDSSLYPEGLVTGYFGRLTSAAVSRFQTRNGLPAVGRVGPRTLVALNAVMGIPVSGLYAPVISGLAVSTGQNSASVNWATNKPASGLVYYGTSFPTMVEATAGTNNATVGGAIAMTDTALRNAQSVTLPNLAANTTYYYVVYTRSATGDVQLTWPRTFRTQ